MILGIHVTIALVSLFYSTYVVFSPSPKKLKLGYLLIFGTLTSGVLLSLESGASIAKICISGLVYTGFILTSTLLARRKIISMKTL